MESIAISEFKATCLAVLERVRQSGQPILVTRRGEPVAEIVPPSPAARPESWLGSARGTGEILATWSRPRPTRVTAMRCAREGAPRYPHLVVGRA